MEEFVKRLHYLDDQPCIMLDNKLYALIDTGAKIPVWTKSESALLTYYPDAKKALDGVNIGLLNGKVTGSVWKLTLVFEKLVYPGIPVFVYPTELNYQFLFADSMFRGLEIRLNQNQNLFHVIKPDTESWVKNLSFETKNGKIVLQQS